MTGFQLPLPLPEWVNSKWFNSVAFVLFLAGTVLSVSDAEWAPKVVAYITAALGVLGLAVKPKP